MKYYYKKSKNGYTYACYMKGDVPINKPIYAFSYDSSNISRYNFDYTKPVKGMIIEKDWLLNHGNSCYGNEVFVPFKRTNDNKGYTDELDYAKYVHYTSRMYADTYKEACEMFNELVEDRVKKIKSELKTTKKHFISPKQVNKNKLLEGLVYGKEN